MTNPQPTPPPKSSARRANALPSACLLDEYRIDSILGAGGFGVTYKALDTHLETWVAIKEYFPVEWSFRDADGVTVHPNTQGESSVAEGQVSDYLWGLERFLDEARVLARVQHPYVVRVKRYFRAHGTAYIVMDYEEGEPLSAVLRDGETLGEEEIRGLLEDVLPALQAVHEQGYLHRDIKPSNLYVRSSDHRVILIDFGAAREAVGRHSKSVTSLVTPGYSPPEQYTTRNDRYGTWTDVYALGAVLYRCITGRTPIEAAERLLDDQMEPAIEAGAGRYSTNLLEVVGRALAVRPEQRFLSVAEMQSALAGSQDENNSQTVVMMPHAKPVKLAQPLGASALAAHPEASGEPPHPSAQRDRLQMTLAPTVGKPHAAAPGSSQTTAHWRLPAILAGGVALMASAAAIVWLGSSEPPPAPAPIAEQKPPPRYSLNPAEETPAPAAETPPTAPAADSAAPAAAQQAAESPSPAEKDLASSPSPAPVEEGEKSSAALAPAETPSPQTALPVESNQPAAEGGAAPEAAQTPSAPPISAPPGIAPLPVAPAATAKPAKPASAASVEAPAPETAKAPAASAKSAGRDAKAPPKRPPQKKAPRKRKEKMLEAAPAPAASAPAAPAAPRSTNLWDAPTESGFNQK